MKDGQLKFNVGDVLQLQISRNDEYDRYYVKVIGYLQHRSLLVTTPRQDGVPMSFREGQQFVVRLLSGNSVYGFEASVLRTSLHPYPYLHLTYPTDLAHMVVRKAQRAETDIIVSVNNNDPSFDDNETQSARIHDISTAGAMLCASESLGDIGQLITINAKFTIAGVEEYLVLPAVIRNSNKRKVPGDSNKEEYYQGVEFQLLEDQHTLVLHGYVNEQLVKQLTSVR